MDKQPSKKRRLAATTLSYKDDMETELNKTLPHDRYEPKRGSGSHPVQSAPLTEEFTEPAPIPTKRGLGSSQSAPPSEKVVAPVKAQPSSAPFFDGPSNSGSRGVYPEGYDYGARFGGC
jgi:hypothetical protein